MNKISLLILIMLFQYGCSSTGPKNVGDAPGAKKASKSVSTNESKDKSESSGVVDPAAIARLEVMGKYLRGLKKFEVKATTTFDIVLENDQKTEFEAKIRYVVHKPDKLFAEIKSDGKHRKYFFNGKKFTIFSPNEKFYGELLIEGPVSDLVKKLNEYGIEVPLSDLFVWGTEEAKDNKVTSAMFLNEEKKGSEFEDHFAVRQDKIDWQIWIKKGVKPLPKKVLYEINDDTARPKMSSNLSWNEAPDFSEQGFEFRPPQGSHKIKLNPARKPEEK